MVAQSTPGPGNDSSPGLSRLDAALAALVFVGALALYTRTLARSLLLGDGAEFQTLAYLLAMTHPTGYPVYLLFGKLFTFVPIGDIASRVNLLSAVSGASTLALIYLSGVRLGGWRVAALLGPAGLGLSGLFWWHAVMAEVYVPAAALLAAVLFLALQWRHGRDPRCLFAAGVAGGLSVGVHVTVALTAPAMLLYLALTARRRADWIAAAAGAASGTALTFIAFLLLDARDIPASYYNTTMRPGASLWGLSAQSFDSTFGRLTFLLSGRQFRWAMFTMPWSMLPQRFKNYQEFLNEGWAPAALAMVALGVVATMRPAGSARRADWRDGLLLLLAWLGLATFALNYDISDIHVFFIPTYVVLAILASVGAATVLDVVAWMGRRDTASSISTGSAGLVATLLLLATLWPRIGDVRAAWAAEQITFLRTTPFANYPYPIRSPDAPHTRAVRMLDPLPGDAVVYADWSMLYCLYYVAHIEQGRMDIIAHELVISRDEYSVAPSFVDSIDSHLGRRPVYVEWVPPGLIGRYTFTRVGTTEPLFLVTKR